MQPTIFAITLVIMAVTLVLIRRAIVPTTGPEPDADTLYNGRRGVMPAWSGRLSEREIRQITMYLLWWAE